MDIKSFTEHLNVNSFSFIVIIVLNGPVTGDINTRTSKVS